MSVLLEVEQLCIPAAWRDGVDSSNHDGEHRIVLFIEADKKVCNQFIITERKSRCGEFICIVCHLGVIISNGEMIPFVVARAIHVFTDRARDCGEYRSVSVHQA
jgi:hypothetical protein